MGEQNQEVLLQALHQITRMHLEISKAGDSLWQVSLDFPNQVKESQPLSVSAADISNLLLEANGTNWQSNPINSVDVDSAGQSSASSETSSEIESSDYSAIDSPVQSSNPNSGVSQSNAIDLPDTNLLDQSLNCQRYKKKSKDCPEEKKTELYCFVSFQKLLEDRFSSEDIKDLCFNFIHFRCRDNSTFEFINSQSKKQEMIRTSLAYFQTRHLFKDVIEYIKKTRTDIKIEEYLTGCDW